MEGAKRITVIAGLLAVILATVVWQLGVSGLLRKRVPPDWFLQSKQEMINERTLETLILTHGEWRELGSKDGKYRAPGSREYVMVPPMTCARCSALIPRPRPPQITTPPVNVGGPDPADREMAWRKTTKCPKCLGCPWPDDDTLFPETR